MSKPVHLAATTATKRPPPPAGFRVTNKYYNKNSTINTNFNKTVYRGIKMFESLNDKQYRNSTLNTNFNKAVQRGINRFETKTTLIHSSTKKMFTLVKTNLPLILSDVLHEVPNEVLHEVPHQVLSEALNEATQKYRNISESAKLILIDSELMPELKSSGLSEIRCYGCLHPSPHCTVPCRYPQKCFLRAPTPYSTSKCSKYEALYI